MARGEVVRAVEHKVGVGGELIELFRLDPGGDRGDLHVGIERAQRATRGVRFLGADRVRAVQDLTLQVRQVDLVGVGDGQLADAGGGQIQRCGTTEATCPDDEDGGGAQLLLSFYPDLGKKDVPRVAEKLLIVNSVWRSSAKRP